MYWDADELNDAKVACYLQDGQFSILVCLQFITW